MIDSAGTSSGQRGTKRGRLVFSMVRDSTPMMKMRCTFRLDVAITNIWVSFEVQVMVAVHQLGHNRRIGRRKGECMQLLARERRDSKQKYDRPANTGHARVSYIGHVKFPSQRRRVSFSDGLHFVGWVPNVKSSNRLAH